MALYRFSNWGAVIEAMVDDTAPLSRNVLRSDMMIIMMKMIIMMMMMIRMTVIPSRVYTTVMRTIMMMVRTGDLGPGPRDRRGAARGARDKRTVMQAAVPGQGEGRVGEAAGRKAEEARSERQGRAEHNGAEGKDRRVEDEREGKRGKGAKGEGGAGRQAGAGANKKKVQQK